jgi:hypothetical protein
VSLAPVAAPAKGCFLCGAAGCRFRFDVVLKEGFGDIELRVDLCEACYPPRERRAIGKSLQRRGFKWGGLWIRSDSSGGHLSAVYDRLEAERPWSRKKIA